MISKSLSSVLLGSALYTSLVLYATAQVPPTSPSPSPSPAPVTEPNGDLKEHHWVHPGPEEMMSRYLQLTDDQKKQLKPIVDQAMAQGKQLLDETKQKVRAILTPEQQAKMDALPAPLGNKKGGWPHLAMGMAPASYPTMPNGNPNNSEPSALSGAMFRAPVLMQGLGVHPSATQAFQAVTEGLNLSPDQKAKVADLIKTQEVQIKSIEDRAHLDVAAIVNNAKIEILPILTPAQLQILADKAKLEADEAAVLEQGLKK